MKIVFPTRHGALFSFSKGCRRSFLFCKVQSEFFRVNIRVVVDKYAFALYLPPKEPKEAKKVSGALQYIGLLLCFYRCEVSLHY